MYVLRKWCWRSLSNAILAAFIAFRLRSSVSPDELSVAEWKKSACRARGNKGKKSCLFWRRTNSKGGFEKTARILPQNWNEGWFYQQRPEEILATLLQGSASPPKQSIRGWLEH